MLHRESLWPFFRTRRGSGGKEKQGLQEFTVLEQPPFTYSIGEILEALLATFTTFTVNITGFHICNIYIQ